MLRIGFVGNFQPSFSTEQERKKAFEELGHEVIMFQENETTALFVMDRIDELDMLVYSHTHGWEIPNLVEVFKKYKEHGVPTVSAHLDRWAWLEREKDIGQEATWFTEFIFMADASPEAIELYQKYNLKWYYLQPGVAKDQCYIAPPDKNRFPYDIVFTGSKNYHPEYPFRKELVEWLQETYGDRFGHYGGDGLGVVREHKLNTLYSTAKIVVGDSCFGGRMNYVSDRYYEARGRGGFLIHPHVQGVDTIGVAHYSHGDLSDLKKKIDYYLENADEREAMRWQGFNHVKNNETYTHRAQEIIDRVFK